MEKYCTATGETFKKATLGAGVAQWVKPPFATPASRISAPEIENHFCFRSSILLNQQMLAQVLGTASGWNCAEYLQVTTKRPSWLKFSQGKAVGDELQMSLGTLITESLLGHGKGYQKANAH